MVPRDTCVCVCFDYDLRNEEMSTDRVYGTNGPTVRWTWPRRLYLYLPTLRGIVLFMKG